MRPSCVNCGGPDSLIKVPIVEALDQEMALPVSVDPALSAWQARCGEVITLVDREAVCYRARLTSVEPGLASCVPFERSNRSVESTLSIQVCQAVPEKERFELVLQKLTELGVNRIVPMETARSATVSERDSVQKKSHRWPDLLISAAKQCRRAMIPELTVPLSFEDALELTGGAELRLILYEGETDWTLTEAIGGLNADSVALMVGPEGGFTKDEVDKACNRGFLPVRLGPRILRTETAAIVAATLLQGQLGDLC